MRLTTSILLLALLLLTQARHLHSHSTEDSSSFPRDRFLRSDENDDDDRESESDQMSLEEESRPKNKVKSAFRHPAHISSFTKTKQNSTVSQGKQDDSSASQSDQSSSSSENKPHRKTIRRKSGQAPKDQFGQVADSKQSQQIAPQNSISFLPQTISQTVAVSETSPTGNAQLQGTLVPKAPSAIQNVAINSQIPVPPTTPILSASNTSSQSMPLPAIPVSSPADMPASSAQISRQQSLFDLLKKSTEEVKNKLVDMNTQKVSVQPSQLPIQVSKAQVPNKEELKSEEKKSEELKSEELKSQELKSQELKSEVANIQKANRQEFNKQHNKQEPAKQEAAKQEPQANESSQFIPSSFIPTARFTSPPVYTAKELTMTKDSLKKISSLQTPGYSHTTNLPGVSFLDSFNPNDGKDTTSEKRKGYEGRQPLAEQNEAKNSRNTGNTP